MSSRLYPIYQKGNPQLRVFLPNFWMKLVKPEHESHPANKVQFIVSSEMTKGDVKSYLENIYKVPVANVKTVNRMGPTRKNMFKGYVMKDPDFKVAYVTLPADYKFEWPDLKIATQLEKVTDQQDKELDGAKEQWNKAVNADSTKYRPGVPTFFGL